MLSIARHVTAVSSSLIIIAHGYQIVSGRYLDYYKSNLIHVYCSLVISDIGTVCRCATAAEQTGILLVPSSRSVCNGDNWCCNHYTYVQSESLTYLFFLLKINRASFLFRILD